MASDNSKNYNILENVLQKISRELALPEEETKRNNHILQMIDQIISKMRSQNILFHNLYQNKFYGGSFYDGLKIGNPSEYDLDCILCLPKLIEAKIEVIDDEPGFVNVVINNMEALEKQPAEASKYKGLEKLLIGNQLSTKKVKSWFEGLMSTVLKEDEHFKIDINNSECLVKTKTSKSGPALTIKLEGVHGDKTFNLDIDFVPCFTFFDEYWPKLGYRANNSKKKTFFVIPKESNAENPEHWRLSFQEQERELIKGCLNLKPSIKLIKKIRDRYNHKIASYYIKTVFLWEWEKTDKSFWENSLSFVFMSMLKKFTEYIEKKNIPYYWNAKNNLIQDLSDNTASCIANKLKNIISSIDRISTVNDVYNIIFFFGSNNDYDIDKFKADVTISKKFLKNFEPIKCQSKENVSCEAEMVLTESSSSSSDNCPLIPDQLAHSSVSLTLPTNLETMCLSLISQQKSMSNRLETIYEKLNACETQISQLSMVINNTQREEITRTNEMMRMISMLQRNVRDLAKDNLRGKSDVEEDIVVEDMLV